MVTVGRDHGYKLRVVITVVPSENDDIARRGDRLAAGSEEVRLQAFKSFDLVNPEEPCLRDRSLRKSNSRFCRVLIIEDC